MRNEPQSPAAVREQIEALRHLTVGQLKERYREVFQEDSRSNHKQFLFRRIAWRIQANAWGGLSERARQRALEVANDADLRIRGPKNFLRQDLDPARTATRAIALSRDPRLPAPGTCLVRQYQGKDVVVLIRDDGFEHGGKIHRSLSAAVRAATGIPWNGFVFFGLSTQPRKSYGR